MTSMDCMMPIAHFVLHFTKTANISKSRGSGELILTPVLGRWSAGFSWSTYLLPEVAVQSCALHQDEIRVNKNNLWNPAWTTDENSVARRKHRVLRCLPVQLIPPRWRGRNRDGGGEGTNIIISFQISSEWMGDVSLNHKIHFVPWACLEWVLNFLQLDHLSCVMIGELCSLGTWVPSPVKWASKLPSYIPEFGLEFSVGNQPACFVWQERQKKNWGQILLRFLLW